ncbi:MAG: HDIG domain-containing metalloprotein, partial [Candidatus Neomarinimicrobiota bacterium]|nr:HDIG domain-containing metalloprotein [Candidatus Neomarinimicrobiota bacterium]
MPSENRETTSLNRFLQFYIYWPQYVIILSLILIIAFLFPRGKTLRYSFQLNDIAREPIIAPFTFSILKTQDRLNSDLDEQLKSVPFVFNRQDKIVTDQSQKISEFFSMVNEIRFANWRFNESKRLVYERRYHKQYEKARSEFVSDSANLTILTSEFHKLYSFAETKENWRTYSTPDQDPRNMKDLRVDQDKIIRICRNRWSEGIYDITYEDILSNEVTVNQGEVPEMASPKDFNNLETAWTSARKELLGLYTEQDIFKDLGYDLIVRFMKPNLIYDRELTEKRQQESLNNVPRSQGVVLQNEMIVDANTRITEDILQKLNSLSTAVVKQGPESGWRKTFFTFTGKFILLSIIVSMFFAYLIVYRIQTFKDWKMVLLITIVFLLQIGLAYIFVIRFEWSEYLVPVTVGAMTLTILFDARIGFMATISVVIAMGLMMGQNIDFVIVSLFTATIAVYNIRELRNRSQLFITMFALMGASILVVVGIGFFKEHGWASMIVDIQSLMINSLLAPIVTYGLIGLFEIGFEVTTDLTLMELLDYDHPLLKKAQQETNGTFNHSIVVGNLAESCAGAIGAHSLLCRVGAYYHDIGKMVKPEYFIENQYTGRNQHDNLTPTMSARIIRNHVKEGLALADEYNLPKIVSDFIPMHHGTTRVEYFYRMAMRKAEQDGSKVDETQFQYPGPKPNTRETGILMICEAVEAAVRSI